MVANLKLWRQKSCIHATLGALACVWFKSTDTIPRVQVNTMSQCLYLESLSIPWVHVYTMSPCQCQESKYIPWDHVFTKSSCQYPDSMSIANVKVWRKVHKKNKHYLWNIAELHHSIKKLESRGTTSVQQEQQQGIPKIKFDNSSPEIAKDLLNLTISF